MVHVDIKASQHLQSSISGFFLLNSTNLLILRGNPGNSIVSQPVSIGTGKREKKVFIMVFPEFPLHEEERLKLLQQYQILDTLQENQFDILQNQL